MDIDDRLRLLVASSASLHARCRELNAATAKPTRLKAVDQSLLARIDRLDEVMKARFDGIDQKLDLLLKLRHQALEARLDRLEKRLEAEE
jgi:hypothetical protein